MFGGTDSCRKCFQYGRRKLKNRYFGGNCIPGSVIPWNLIYEEMQAMIILPECTYATDCTVIDLKEDEQFEIVL